MITFDRSKKILQLSLPVAVGLGSSLIMVFVDLAMIGSIGTDALAAIGLAGFSYTIILSFVSGVAPAVQGIVARLHGQNSDEPSCLPLNAGLLLVLLIGVPISTACYFLTSTYFSAISAYADVVAQGVPYLKALCFAVVAVGLNQAFQGFWTGISKTKIYMFNVVLVNCLNIFLNYVFIFGNFGAPELGTGGAGIATAIAVYFGTSLYFLQTIIFHKKNGFLTVRPHFTLVKRIFRVGIHENVREIVFSLGYLVFFWMVGMIGAKELAATNVLVRVGLILVVFSRALGVASSTLVSQALGRGNFDDASQWGWETGKVGVITITILGLPMLLFPEWFLSIFLSDPETIAMSVIPMQLTGGLAGLASLIYIYAYTLVSLGDGKRVVVVSFATQWVIFLPVVWIVGPYLNFGLLEIWLVQIAYGLLAAGIFTALWHGGRWKNISS